MEFEIQRFAYDYARTAQERDYQGRRRLSGNYGRVYIGGELIFEISSFSAKVTAEREDVYIGASKDSKITGLVGEGEIVIKQVFNRGYKALLEDWQKGHDTRFTIVGELDDPDALGNAKERIAIRNAWINELELMKFEKGSVVEKTVPFGFVPYDVEYTHIIAESNSGTGIG